jgi:membrane fusion protein (multidrug efflux system)
VGGSLDLTRQRYTENGAVPQPLAGSTRSSGTLQLAGGWELDFFGRYRAQLRAALGAQLAAQAELAAARVLLAAEVARQYVQLARLVALRHVAEQGLAQRQAMLELIRQRVAAGAPLMAVVPLSQVWVDANFKESQLRRLRIGQSVTLTADVYGDGVTFHGTVAGLGAGTGAAFSLLPAQNATGNWIKVVQRVPVRIALDATELAEHPLRVGLSMEARVDVRRQDGRALADGVRETSAVRTEVFGDLEREAQARIDRIIATHLGRAAPAPARS